MKEQMTDASSGPQRVQKLLAQAGIASRRTCEDYIKEGRVTVNGKAVAIGATASVGDDIRLDGKPVALEKQVHIILNKPKGVTSTVYDPHASRTVLDLVKVPQRIFPVGRLDRETEGLILLTNDGALMQHITHPSHGVDKTYIASTVKTIGPTMIERLKFGVMVENKMVKIKNVVELAPNVVRLSVHEGRKHIVRNIFAALGNPVKRLVRIAIGPIELGDLEPGKWRYLTERELSLLRKSM